MMLEKIRVSTHQRNQLVDITEQIETVIKRNKTKQGTVHVYCPHTTAAITAKAEVTNNTVRHAGIPP